jgi:hypothetical protein
MIWPFKPLSPLVEELKWQTDVFRAKGAEQRHAILETPRRTLNFSHVLTDLEYAHARRIMRQAASFLVPDWAQSQKIGPVSPGSSVSLSADLTYVDMSPTALLWDSNSHYEQVTLTGTTAATVTKEYASARLIPLWPGYPVDGLSNSRGAARINQLSIAFDIDSQSDLSASDYPQYRGHDVMTSCPIIGGGEFDERIVWPVSVFDNQSGIRSYIKQRTIPDLTFQMRWHEFSAAEIWDVRGWLHSRKGRQKAFWLSSRAKDLEPVSDISGTTATVYGPVRAAPFDIDVDGQYRQVTNVAPGSPVNGRETAVLTIADLTASNIQRISFLRCARFDADRIEIEHQAAGGASIQVPCIEIPVP